LVEGVNMIKKHVKPNPNVNEPGGVKEIEAFVDISNVKLFDVAAKKGDRVGFRTLEHGRKVRYFKSSGEVISAADGG
jgi:large subunit ribosomal protein L24